MKEKPAYDSAENDSSEDSGSDKKNKKTTKIARAIPLGLELGNDNKTGSRVEKPRLSISERLFQQMDMRATKAKDAEKDSDTEAATTDTELVASAPSYEPIKAEISEAALEASDWGGEFDLQGDNGEIDLKKTTLAEKSEDNTQFVEIPTEAVETATSATEESVEPELLERGLESETDEAPVLTVSESAHSASGSYGSPERPWYDAVAADRMRRKHEEDINDAQYRGEKRGQRRGLGAGLLVGWLFGRHGKNKAQKEHAKELKTKKEEIKSLKAEQAVATERLDAIKRNQERLGSNMHKVEASRPQALQNEAQTPKLSPAHAETSPRSVLSSNERSSAAARPNTNKSPKAEVLPEDQVITEETYQAGDGRRIETSAWHRFEVDAKTGKLVDDPEISYGEEFKRERRQEIISDGKVSSDGRVSSLGGLAASVATDANQDGSYTNQKWDGSLQVDRKESEETHSHLSAGNEVLRYASRPVTWVFAVAIVVALFIFGVLR